MKRFEQLIYVAAMAVLSVALFSEGRRAAALDEREQLSPKALYALLGNPQVKLQIIDLRPYDDDNYVDNHVPGAVPMPDCDLDKAPEKARDRVYSYVPTILITGDGTSPALEACKARFAAVRILQGGQSAWSDANLPEEPGEYSPPKNAAGGGCL